MISPRLLLLPVTLIVGVPLSGCAESKAFVGPVSFSSSADIAVVRAVAHRDKDERVVVDGDVRRPNGYAGVVPGHLRVEGRNAGGAVVAATDANWGEFMNRRFRRAYFHAVLPAGDASTITSISVRPITTGTH